MKLIHYFSTNSATLTTNDINKEIKRKKLNKS